MVNEGKYISADVMERICNRQHLIVQTKEVTKELWETVMREGIRDGVVTWNPWYADRHFKIEEE